MASSGCRAVEASSQHELAVERDDLAVAQDGQRIDLDQLGVLLAKRPVELDEHIGDAVGRRAEVQPLEQRRRLRRAEAMPDVDDMAPDRVGLSFGDFLDVHAAFGREQHQRDCAADIDQHRGIELAFNRAALLDQHALDAAAADRHAEDGARRRGAFLRRYSPS